MSPLATSRDFLPMASSIRAGSQVQQPLATVVIGGTVSSTRRVLCVRVLCMRVLWPQRDPVAGENSYVFSCFNQDQPLDCVDWKVLNERLNQSSLADKLTAKWLKQRVAQLQRERPFALSRGSGLWVAIHGDWCMHHR